MGYGNAEKKGNSPRKPPCMSLLLFCAYLKMDYQICVSSELPHCNVSFAPHDKKYIGILSSQPGLSAMQSH